MGTKIIDCLTKFLTGGPTDWGEVTQHFNTWGNVANNLYAAESCTARECFGLHKRFAARTVVKQKVVGPASCHWVYLHQKAFTLKSHCVMFTDHRKLYRCSLSSLSLFYLLNTPGTAYLTGIVFPSMCHMCLSVTVCDLGIK